MFKLRTVSELITVPHSSGVTVTVVVIVGLAVVVTVCV